MDEKEFKTPTAQGDWVETMGSSTRTRGALRVAPVLVLLVAVLAFAGVAGAATLGDTAASTAPWVQSDQSDYLAGSTVSLTGGGWQPGETVKISTNDTLGNTWNRTDTVVADTSGVIADSFSLPDYFISDYTVVATGSSGTTATTTFTDAADSIQFATTGLPAGANVSVSWSGTNNGGNSISGPTVFAAPGPAPNNAIGVRSATSFTCSFPATITVGVDTYNRNSTVPCPITTPDTGSAVGVVLTQGYTKAAPSDTTPPTLHLPADITAEATGASGAVVTFTATADDANPTHPTVNCTPASGSTFALGATTVNCSATDAASNTANGSFKVTVQDTTPPTTTLASTPTDPSNSASASFSFTGADTVTASVSFECSLDGGAYAACASPKSYASLSDGSHTFDVRAKDGAGNVDATPEPFAWVIDTTAPAVSAPDLDAASDLGVSSTDNKTKAANLVFNGTAEAGSTVKLYRGATLVDSATATGGSWSITDSSPAEGVFAYTATATDGVGNVSSPSSGLSVTVDRTAPATDCASADGIWHASNVDIACTGGDEASGLADPTDASFNLSTSVADGSETANASTGSRDVFDVAGNKATAGPISGNKVDRKAPTITDAGVQSGTAGSNGWYISAVVNRFTASDDGSGLGSACAAAFPKDPSTGTNEGTAVKVASGTCTDAVGNTASSIDSAAFKIDLHDPTVNCGTADSAWHAANVEVACTASDSGSGLADAGDGSFTLSTTVAEDSETGNASTGSRNVTDNAGRSTQAGPISGNKVDRKAPQLTDCDTADGAWHAANVTLHCTYTDGGSGPASQQVALATSVAAGDEDGNAAASAGTAQACDAVSNCAASPDDITGNEVDRKAPTITDNGPTATPDGSNGWYTHDVANQFSAAEGGSGLAAPCVSSWTKTTSGEGNAVKVASGSCADAVGNVAASIDSALFKIDKTTPTISASVTSPSSVNGLNGWYITAPTVKFTCNDGVSGIDSCVADDASPIDSITLGESAAAQTVGGTATDKAGWTKTASVSGLKVDLSDPSVTSWNGGPIDGTTYNYGFVPTAPTCIGSDAISGIASCVVTGYSNAVGPHTMTATATDNAGRTKHETRSYTVAGWTVSGFYQPVDMPTATSTVYNATKAGSTVPLKFELFAGPTELTAIAYVTSLKYAPMACDASAVSDDVPTLATGGTSLRYDTTAGQYVYNWQTPKQAGCYRVTVAMQDASSLVAYFRLK